MRVRIPSYLYLFTCLYNLASQPNGSNGAIINLKRVEYRDAIRSKETRQRRPGERDAVVQWIMAVYFELTSLARVKFPPHKPYIILSRSTSVLLCMMHSYDFIS